MKRINNIRKDNIKEAFQDFDNLEHRLESIKTLNGVEWINDSKACNVNSTWYSLEMMEKPVILIIGGIDKGTDFKPLKNMILQKVKTIIVLGDSSPNLFLFFVDLFEKENRDKVRIVYSMEQAVGFAYGSAKKGDAVLLSPATSSFDMFKDYEDRGRQFKKAVAGL